MKNKYIKEVVGYEIKISTHEMQTWEEMIRSNNGITPEIFGMLIGRSKPVIENAKCRICNEKILETEQIDPKYMDRITYYRNLHNKCYEELRSDNKDKQ